MEANQPRQGDASPPADRGTPAPTESPRRRDDLEVGEAIDDFLLRARLGQGSFATVYLADQRSLGRTVALKVALAEMQEAVTLAQLDHPNIVRVYDQRALPDRMLTLLYMEFVPGGTLQRVIDRVRETPPAERSGRLLIGLIDEALTARGLEPPSDSRLRERFLRASWAEAVCLIGAHLSTGLAHAHENAVFHRDVKPANVLLSANGRAKLADFNISYSDALSEVRKALVGGTFPYMAPEQLEVITSSDRTVEALDARTDIYALAMVLWELLTGTLPFPYEQEGAFWQEAAACTIELRRTGLDAEALDALPPGTPRLLGDTLRRCLAGPPEERIQSGADLARHFELCLEPRVRRLLLPARRGWRAWLQRFPTTGLLLTAFLPNAILSVLSVIYNFNAVVACTPHQPVFERIVWTVNAVAFPVGVFLMWLWIRPIGAAVRKRRAGGALPSEERTIARKKALRLGDATALITLPLWLVGGLAFPIWLALGGTLPEGAYLHFTLTNFLFGIVAAATCFFVLNFLTLRALFPRLIRPGDTDPMSVRRMQRLRRRMAYYFAALTSVPFVSVIILSLSKTQLQAAYTVLGIVGAMAFGTAIWLNRQVPRDLKAFEIALGTKARDDDVLE